MHYMMNGEEILGYADYSNSKIILMNMIIKKIEYYSSLANESFFIFKEDMYEIFYSEDVYIGQGSVNN